MHWCCFDGEGVGLYNQKGASLTDKCSPPLPQEHHGCLSESTACREPEEPAVGVQADGAAARGRRGGGRPH